MSKIEYRIETLLRFAELPAIKLPASEGWEAAITGIESVERARELLEDCQQRYPGEYRIIKIETIETVIKETKNTPSGAEVREG